MPSANPATKPASSRTGSAVTAATTPDVPIETIDVALVGAEAERRGGVVAEARTECLPARGGPLRRAEHGRQVRAATTHGQLEEVEPVVAARGVVITGAAGVAAIGGQRRDVGVTAQPPRQPVVRQADGRRAIGMLRFVVGEPPQLGHRDRGQRHDTDGLRPRPRAAELVDERARRVGRTHVVPQQRGPHHLAGLVEAHHAVLLRTDRDRLDAVQSTRGRDRLPRGGFPCRRGDFGAVGMGGRGPRGSPRRWRHHRSVPCRTASTSRCRRPGS